MTDWVPPRLGSDLSRRFEAMWRGQQPIDENEGLLRVAVAHQIAAPIADRAVKRGATLAQAWAERLEAVRAQNLIMGMAAAELAKHFDACGGPWLIARGVSRLDDGLIGERTAGDLDLYVSPGEWPEWEAHLLELPGMVRNETTGEFNRSTRHFRFERGAMTVEVDLHLAVSPFHAIGDPLLNGVLERRRRNGRGLWVPSLEDDYGLALVEALIEAPANRLRRLWELEILAQRLSAGQRQRMRRRFGLRRWAEPLPRQIFDSLQGRLVMRHRHQLMVRYGGLLALILGSRHPVAQTWSSVGMMLECFRR